MDLYSSSHIHVAMDFAWLSSRPGRSRNLQLERATFSPTKRWHTLFHTFAEHDVCMMNFIRSCDIMIEMSCCKASCHGRMHVMHHLPTFLEMSCHIFIQIMSWPMLSIMQWHSVNNVVKTVTLKSSHTMKQCVRVIYLHESCHEEHTNESFMTNFANDANMQLGDRHNDAIKWLCTYLKWFVMLTLSSWQVHDDALWCTIMHNDALRRTTMHYDALCIRMHYDALCTMIHYDILCTAMHYDALWCTVHYDALWCTVHYDALWCIVHYDALWCTVHYDALWCNVHYDALWCTVHYDALWCTAHYDTLWYIMHDDALRCTMMHCALLCTMMHCALWCTMMHCALWYTMTYYAQRCTTMHYDALCTMMHYDALRTMIYYDIICTMMHYALCKIYDALYRNTIRHVWEAP